MMFRELTGPLASRGAYIHQGPMCGEHVASLGLHMQLIWDGSQIRGTSSHRVDTC